MRKSITAGLALWATFAAFAGKVHAEVNYPWCIIGDTRGLECVFSSREQCAQDGRNRGFGGQCIQNPYYKPGQPPTVSGKKQTETARPSQAVSGAATCTELKSACLLGKDCGYGTAPCGGQGFCNYAWGHCMKTGFWEGRFLHRAAERR
jgi:Protein of unknown function (DUF3551)